MLRIDDATFTHALSVELLNGNYVVSGVAHHKLQSWTTACTYYLHWDGCLYVHAVGERDTGFYPSQEAAERALSACLWGVPVTHVDRNVHYLNRRVVGKDSLIVRARR